MPECETCRFYREKECRRRAPVTFNFLLYHELELLRDIAWSVRLLAKLPVGEADYDVKTEASEMTSWGAWPNVQPYDWCGEWEKNA
jgi:hypothetical protein